MESMTQIKKCIKKVSLYQNLWYTLENEILGCTRGFMGFSGFLKTSGTPWRMRLLVYQRFYGVLWIFENLWYTWRMRFLRAPGFYRLLWIFKNIWHTLRRWDSLCVPDFIVFVWFFVEGRTSRSEWPMIRTVIFFFFDQFSCFSGWQNSADYKLPEDPRCLKVSMGACDD